MDACSLKQASFGLGCALHQRLIYTHCIIVHVFDSKDAVLDLFNRPDTVDTLPIESHSPIRLRLELSDPDRPEDNLLLRLQQVLLRMIFFEELKHLLNRTCIRSSQGVHLYV